jgi:ParB family chromosome partitioning protein
VNEQDDKDAVLRTKPVLISEIYIDDIFNSRGQLAPIDVQDLVDDIPINGLLQPVIVAEMGEAEKTVTGKVYKLIAGFRRTYAHIVLKRDSIPAIIRQTMSPRAALLMNLAENVKRKELNIGQEAKAVLALSNTGMSQQEIAKQLAVSQAWVSVRIRFHNQPDEVKEAASKGVINQQQLQRIAQLPDRETKLKAIGKIKEAKERGEDVDKVLSSRKAPKPHEKRVRKPREIEAAINQIIDQIGPSLCTRALAWAAGNINDIEFEGFIRESNSEFLGFNFASEDD